MDVWVTQVGTGKFYNLTQGAETGHRQFIAPHAGLHPRRHPRDVLETRHRFGGHAHRHLGGTGAGRAAAAVSRRCGGSGLVRRRNAPRVPHPRTRAIPCSSAMRRQSEARHDLLSLTRASRPLPDLVAGSGIHLLRSVRWKGRSPNAWTSGASGRPGGTPERITHHDSRVTHPVFLDARTLAYLASDPDGSGPWLHTLDIEAARPPPRELRTRELHVSRRERRWPPPGRNA